MANEKLIYASAARKAILKADPKLAHCIDSVPGVDAVEVVHGKWEMGVDEGDYEYGTCSACGYNEYNAFCCLLPHNYCPNCGAKMDGGNEDA